MSFHVGQRVVCIAEAGDLDGLNSWPREGVVYTVRE
jgi:hypothetical protein